MTALEQGLFVVDKAGRIRHRIVLGPVDPIPSVDTLRDVILRETAVARA